MRWWRWDADQELRSGSFGRFFERIDRSQVVAFYVLLLVLSWPYPFLIMGGADSFTRMIPLVLVGPSVPAFIVVHAARGWKGFVGSVGVPSGACTRVHIYPLLLIGLPACFMGAT